MCKTGKDAFKTDKTENELTQVQMRDGGRRESRSGVRNGERCTWHSREHVRDDVDGGANFDVDVGVEDQ